MLTYEQAQAQVHAWTKTDSLLKHARAVEITMRGAINRFSRRAVQYVSR